MLPVNISNTQELCTFLDDFVKKQEGELNTETLRKIVTHLNFTEEIDEKSPLHELKNTTEPEGKIQLLANIYLRQKSKADAEVKAKILNVLEETVTSKPTLAKIKRAKTFLKIKGLPKLLLKKLGDFVKKLITLAKSLPEAIRGAFTKKVENLDKAVKSEDPEAIKKELSNVQKGLENLGPEAQEMHQNLEELKNEIEAKFKKVGEPKK